MALFGKKGKDGAPNSDVGAGLDAGADNGGVALADAPVTDAVAPVGGKKVKATRAPKVSKGKTVKNGVAVGLNIGNQFIKAVEVTSRNGELTVTGMGAVPTPAESYTNGNVLSVSALSGAIKDLWRGAGIKSKVAITSVAGTGALVVRVIEVPRMSDGELGDNMKVDADRYIPFPPSEVVMDFKALRELPTDPDAPNMEVLLAAAQREIIDLHVQVVQKAKLDPRAIDVEPIAAARALQLERTGGAFIDYNEITAIVNLGATGTEISILRGDILVFTRVVPGGGNVITQAIANGLGLPFADAERVKIDRADAQAPAGYGNQAVNDFGSGSESDDFNFGGEEFSGGDLNSAFDDISANPTASAASDDPFDLDFFNQGPKDEPGAGHAQKEGEPGEATPAFNFSGFDFDAPATDAPTTPSSLQQSQPVAGATPDAAASPTPPGFNFGFDDLSSEDTPAGTPVEDDAIAPISIDKRTAHLEEVQGQNPAAQNASAAPSSGILGDDFSMPGSFSMPSAFDFDNFDLPAAAPESSATFSTPIESVPKPIVVPVTTAPTSFDFGATPVVLPSPGDTTPASFDFEDDDLASKSTVSPIIPETVVPEAAISESPTPIDFSLSEPIVTSPIVSLPVAQMEEVPIAVVPTAESSPSLATPIASGADEFDLDAIFGSTPAPTATVAPPIATIAPSATGIDFEDDFTAPIVAPVSATSSNDDFDLSGIDTGISDGFAVGFGETNDFNTFGAGLGAGGDSAEAASLYGLVYPSLEELAGEVRRSLEFHLGRYPDATISRLVLLGGGARLRNLDVFLTQSLGVPTTVANPFAHITVQTPKLAPGYANENGPLCAVALGLALRDFVD